jgi:hypothetical protein
MSPSWEAASRSDIKKFPSNLWNQKVHFRVRKSLPLVPILSQMNPVNGNLFYFSKIRFNITLSPTSRSYKW